MSAPTMAFVTPSGTTLQFPKVDPNQDFDTIRPREFIGELFRLNLNAPWHEINPTTLNGIKHRLRQTMLTRSGDADSGLQELGQKSGSKAATAGPSTKKGRKKGHKKASRSALLQWKFIGKLVKQNLPAVPSHLLMSTGSGPPLTFKVQGGGRIRVPRIDGRMFEKNDLDVKQFIKVLNADNENRIIDGNVIRKALRYFARHGFPAAPSSLYQPHDNHTANIQSLSDPASESASRTEGKTTSSRLIEMPPQPSGTGSYREISLSSDVRKAITSKYRFPKKYRKALASEDRGLSIVLPEEENLKAEREATKAHIYTRISEVAGKGLVQAVWYEQDELVLVYRTFEDRRKAFRDLCWKKANLGIQYIRKLGQDPPRRYMVWSSRLPPERTIEDLVSILRSYFAVARYSSSVIIDNTISEKARVVFENTPPYLDSGRLRWPDGRNILIKSQLSKSYSVSDNNAQQRAIRPDHDLGNMDAGDEAESSGISEDLSTDDENSELHHDSGSRHDVGSSAEDGSDRDDEDESSDFAGNDDDDDDDGDTDTQDNAVSPAEEGASADKTMQSPIEADPFLLNRARETGGSFESADNVNTALHATVTLEAINHDANQNNNINVAAGTKRKASDPLTTQVDTKRHRRENSNPVRELVPEEDVLCLLERHLEEQLSKARLQ